MDGKKASCVNGLKNESNCQIVCFRGLFCSRKWTFWNLKSEFCLLLEWEAPKPVLPVAFNSVDLLKCMK